MGPGYIGYNKKGHLLNFLLGPGHSCGHGHFISQLGYCGSLLAGLHIAFEATFGPSLPNP